MDLPVYLCPDLYPFGLFTILSFPHAPVISSSVLQTVLRDAEISEQLRRKGGTNITNIYIGKTFPKDTLREKMFSFALSP